MVKVPKSEIGDKVINAGQYMLDEINKRVEEYISSLSPDSKLLGALKDIDNSQTEDELRRKIEARFTSEEGIDLSKRGARKGLTIKAPISRISTYNALDEEQSLEKNKIIAKMTLLERVGGMKPIIPYTANNNLLVQTVGNAFSSLELIHYGDIEKESIIDVPKEIVDIFALLQQLDGQDKEEVVRDLKREIIKFVNEGKHIEIPENSPLLKEYSVRDNISIEEMYDLTDGKVEYGRANSIVKNMFFLSKSQANAKELAKVLTQITGNDSKYREIIQYISDNGFEIEPEIITRQSNKGIKLSESVSLDLKNEEASLVEKIKDLSEQEELDILDKGGLSNVRNKDKISKEEYYAEAIISLYNWQKIGIEEFTLEEKNNLIQKLQDEYCLELYQKLEERGIDRQDIPAILLNTITRSKDFEVTENDTKQTIKEKRLKQYDRILNENIEDLNKDLSIERIERFLGYYDVEGTRIKLRPYQQRAADNAKEILRDNRFASVILPTGAGKSFVALSQLMEHKDEEILYLAPQNEIIEQMKDYIIKYIHGPVNTIRKK